MKNKTFYLLQLQINQTPLSFEHHADVAQYQQIYTKESTAFEAAIDWVRRAAYPLVKDIMVFVEDKSSFLYNDYSRRFQKTCIKIIQYYNEIESISSLQELNKLIGRFHHLLDDYDFVSYAFDGFLGDKPYAHFCIECTGQNSYYFFVLKTQEPDEFFSTFGLSEPYDAPTSVKVVTGFVKSRRG